jgi:hypothetical protein
MGSRASANAANTGSAAATAVTGSLAFKTGTTNAPCTAIASMAAVAVSAIGTTNAAITSDTPCTTPAPSAAIAAALRNSQGRSTGSVCTGTTVCTQSTPARIATMG